MAIQVVVEAEVVEDFFAQCPLITQLMGNSFAEGQSIHFVAASQYFTGTVTYDWTAAPNSISMGSGGILDYAFSSPDDYQITVTADDSICVDTATITLHIIANEPPTVNITSPPNGTYFDEGELITFTGEAADYEDGDLSNQINWFVDGVLTQSGSASYSTASLIPGSHAIEAKVTDSNGEINLLPAIISIVVDSTVGPVVTILSPNDRENFPSGVPVIFTAQAIDAKDGNVSSRIQWTVDGGSAGSGASISVPGLSTGEHVIVASATDNDNNPGEPDSITIIVSPGRPPTIEITSPAAGSVFEDGATITFTAFAQDPDGNLDHIDWYKNDVFFGSGASINRVFSLPVGQTFDETYTIRAEAVDTENKRTSASILITIRANTAPQIYIDAPVDQAQFTQGATITFQGHATDLQDDDAALTASIQWYSDQEGVNPIGTGGSFTRNNLKTGNHVITARVTNSGGRTASITRNITVTVNFCAALSYSSPIDLVANKGYMTWDIINNGTNGSFSFTLVGIEVQWVISLPLDKNVNSITLEGKALLSGLLPELSPAHCDRFRKLDEYGIELRF